MRIVSLVPSLTKTIFDFGLGPQIVGITNFCVDPPYLYKSASRFGGTKDPDLSIIRDLKPTHVVVNEEENTPEVIQALKRDFAVLTTFPRTPADVPAMLRDLGRFLDVSEVAEKFALHTENSLRGVPANTPAIRGMGPRFIYLIWRDPWMAAGQDTYISKFLELLGFENAVLDSSRYPVIELDKVVSMNPDVIFMSSEPWPFRRRDAADWRAKASAGEIPIYWIDGKAMSWYGSLTSEAISDWLTGENIIRQMN